MTPDIQKGKGQLHCDIIIFCIIQRQFWISNLTWCVEAYNRDVNLTSLNLWHKLILISL